MIITPNPRLPPLMIDARGAGRIVSFQICIHNVVFAITTPRQFQDVDEILHLEADSLKQDVLKRQAWLAPSIPSTQQGAGSLFAGGHWSPCQSQSSWSLWLPWSFQSSRSSWSPWSSRSLCHHDDHLFMVKRSLLRIGFKEGKTILTRFSPQRDLVIMKSLWHLIIIIVLVRPRLQKVFPLLIAIATTVSLISLLVLTLSLLILSLSLLLVSSKIGLTTGLKREAIIKEKR